jgi:hypothetical protein
MNLVWSDLDCSDHDPWLERMNAWNQHQPEEWGYTRVVNFRRDCKKGHWFSVMGTFLPFEIITYAI